MLNVRRKKFCDEWLKNGGNGTQAALAAFNCKNNNSAKAMASELLKNEEVQSYLADKQLKLEQRFEKESVLAFETIINIITDKKTSARTRLDACKDILDRAGYKPKDTVEISGTIEHDTRYTREIANRARQLLDEPINITPAVPVLETSPEPD